jgi:hypothetical protein
MTDIIQFPNSKNITQPKPINLIDTAIVALEAIENGGYFVDTCLDLLRIEKKSLEVRGQASE